MSLFKSLFCATTLLVSSISFAQTEFEPYLHPSPNIVTNISATSSGTVNIADLNGDGFKDVLVTGALKIGTNVTRLYISNGDARNFTLKETPFTGVALSAVAIADLNGDTFPDVIIAGRDGTGISSEVITELFFNDGNGNFTKQSSPGFTPSQGGSISIGDLNQDTYPDVFITGHNGFVRRARMYFNDGAGNFTHQTSTTFTSVDNSASIIADLNGDDLNDIFYVGEQGTNDRVAKFYSNDGDGTFTEVIGHAVVGVERGDIAVGDVNGDDTPDLLLVGESDSGPDAKLYTNDGSGTFTAVDGTPFANVLESKVALEDLNDDTFLDAVIFGTDGGTSFMKHYENDGLGTFTEVVNDDLVPTFRGELAIGDLNGDLLPEVITVANTESYLYLNNDVEGLKLNIESPFQPVYSASVVAADMNDDTTLDILLTGVTNPSEYYFGIYEQSLEGFFYEKSDLSLPAYAEAKLAVGDLNGDTFPDVIYTGYSVGNGIIHVYHNDGSGNYTEVFDHGLPGTYSGSVDILDLDGDLKNDVFLTGDTGPNNISNLYINDGTGVFTLKAGTPFPALKNSTANFEDLNDDGIADLFLTGYDDSNRVTELYYNDGSANFTASTFDFTAIRSGTVEVVSFNEDDFPDILYVGSSSSGFVIKLYLSNGVGGFTDFEGHLLDGLSINKFFVSDLDNDADQDIFFVFTGETSDRTESVYLNQGDATFAKADGISFESSINAAALVTDLNGDNYPDIFLSGRNFQTKAFSKLYLNAPTFEFVVSSESTADFAENGDGEVLDINASYSGEIDEGISYSLAMGGDNNYFSIDTDGKITFATPPDFENPQDENGDNAYVIEVTITDINSNNEITQVVTITVTDLDEIAPTITSGNALSIAENTTGTIYSATANESVTFSLGTTKDEDLFTLTTDVLSFNSSPDFENPQDGNGDNAYLIDLIATDDSGNATTLEVTITVTDEDEVAPTITSSNAVSIVENTSGTIYIATADESVTFSLGTTKDEDLFTLTTDALSFNSSPDFENPQDGNGDNDYVIDLIATDGSGNTTTLEVTITVIDKEDEIAPSITSANAVSIAENTTGTIYSATADESVTFSLGTTKDEDLFTLTIDLLSFTSSPDFENPQDGNGDNAYVIDLIATDDGGNATTLEVTITVIDEDEVAPTITSTNAVSIEENTSGTIYSATADESVTFSLGTTKDEDLFTLTTDALSFNSSPDFENAQDGNGDNDYVIDLIATDGSGNTTTLEVTITVTDEDENVLLTLPRAEDLSVYPNPARNYFQLSRSVPSALSVHLMDAKGQKVLNYRISDGNVYSISQLPDGIYFVIINTKKTRYFVDRLVLK